MDNARKWVMIPAESENSSTIDSVTNDDIILLIKLVQKGVVNEKGEIADSNGKLIIGSSVFDFLTKKSSAKHYNKFLELKANLTGKSLKPAKKQKNDKREKRKWEWSDDDD